MVPHLTKQDLEAVRERADRATPAPWCVAGSPRDFVVARHGGSERCSDNPVFWAEDDCLACNRADAEFVAGARADVPRLLDEVDRLREILNRALVWQLGPTFAVDIRARCPDRDLADEIAVVCSSQSG
jgi:hypothetical protein